MSTEKFYNRKAQSYHMNASRRKHILELIPSESKNALDIGCGSGELSSILKQRGIDVVGVDISEKALLNAKEFLSETFCFDLGASQWPDRLMGKKFDLIIASEVIEHLFDTENFLSKLRSVLSQNGRLIITTPNFLFWKNRIKILFGDFKYEETGLCDSGHIRFFTVSTLKEVLENTGLEIEREHHFYPNLYKRKLNFVGNIFPNLFAYQMIFKVRIHNDY